MTAEGSIWIIGASSGIGRALAQLLSQDGWRLMLSARNADALVELASQTHGMAFPCDATNRTEMQEAAAAVFADGLVEKIVFNVGDYQPMGLNNFDSEGIEAIMRANFFSAAQLLEILLPHLRKQGGGEVLFNASASVYRGLPNAAAYGSSKAALVHMIETLTPEAAKENIRLRIINPGFVRTRLTERNDFDMPFLMEPQQAAERIAAGMQKKRFEIAFPKRLIWILKTMSALPYSWYFALTARMLK